MNFPQNDEKKYDKSAVMEILQIFGIVSHVDCPSAF